MCGLIGMASSEGAREAKARQSALFDGLWMNALRGDHSTGFACIPRGKEREEPMIWKKALNGPDFLGLDRTRKYLLDVDKYSMLLGHNRAATMGTHVSYNAHPFQFGHITLTHNGHVNNAQTLLDYARRPAHEVDSAHVAAAMELLGEQEVLERCTGAFAFVWHNAKDGTLNVARNSSRPLKLAYVRNENTLWWMSERLMLRTILERNGISIDKEMLNLPENMWVKFKMDNLREYTTTPFVHRSPGMARSVAGTTGATSGHTTVNGKIKTPTDNKEIMAHGGRIAAIQEDLITRILATIKTPKSTISKREFDIGRTSGRPKGAKKIRRAEEKLATSGFSLNQEVIVDLSVWSAYRGQTQLGSAAGVILNTKVPVHLSQLELGRFTAYRKLPIFLGRVIGVKPDRHGVQSLMVEPHALAEEFASMWERRERDKSKSGREVQSDYPRPVLSLPKPVDIPIVSQPAANDPPEVGEDKPHSCMGPGNRSIGLDRYRELIKNGCSICTGDIGETAEHSKRVLWMNTDPVCWDCANNPKVMVDYGLEQVFDSNVVH